MHFDSCSDPGSTIVLRVRSCLSGRNTQGKKKYVWESFNRARKTKTDREGWRKMKSTGHFNHTDFNSQNWVKTVMTKRPVLSSFWSSLFYPVVPIFSKDAKKKWAKPAGWTGTSSSAGLPKMRVNHLLRFAAKIANKKNGPRSIFLSCMRCFIELCSYRNRSLRMVHSCSLCKLALLLGSLTTSVVVATWQTSATELWTMFD